MLKGFVSGEEKDIVRIPMKGRNLWDPESRTTNQVGQPAWGVVLPAGVYTIVNNSNTPVYQRDGVDSTQATTFAAAGATKTIRFNNTLVAWTSSKKTQIMLNLGSTPLPYEPYGYQEGWEVRDNQDRIIWGREDELQTVTGTLPFKGYGLPLKTKSLLGNTVQNGTPAPDNIIIPEMCGVRTGNLCAIPSVSANFGDLTVAANGDTFSLTGTVTEISRSNNFWKRFDFVLSAGDYTIKLGVPRSYQSGYSAYLVEYDTGTTLASISGASASAATFTLTNDTHVYIGFYIYNKTLSDDKWILMLNLGSTALPYEPYGWKVPFENHGENLLNKTEFTGVSATIEQVDNGIRVITENGGYAARIILDVQENTDYTLSYIWKKISGAASNVTKVFAGTGSSTEIASFSNNKGGTFNTGDNTKINIWFYAAFGAKATVEYTDIMLTPGSEAKPYSPYLNETLPVYLGEVPTVRRVKKLVLDGTENWTNVGGQAPFQHLPSNFGMLSQDVAFYICSHYKAIAYNDSWTSNDKFVSASAQGLRFKDSSFNQSLDDFKSFLASEYAAGTPVTIWYVLATEETTISNEPLCKISTYADELTTIQVHGLSAPLYGIGDYKDTLNLSTGVVTRKVKKLVLTGEENVNIDTNLRFTVYVNDIKTATSRTGRSYCSQYECLYNAEPYDNDWTNIYYQSGATLYFHDKRFATLADFKSYLAAQYQAGTPVTIWYVLNTPETETVTVPTGMTGEIEGYLTQVSTPTPTNRSVPKWNGVEETGGTYAVTVYTPPEIPTTTGENTLTVDTDLAPSKLEVSVHAKKIHYGFKIDKSNDNSEDAVIYTHDAVTMTPAHMDFTNDRFDYGSWGNAFFVRDCYPVALNLDGTEAYRLDPDDYTKKMDGTASDIFYELLTAEPSDWSTQWKQYYTKSGDEYVLNSQSEAPTFTTDTYYKLTYTSSFTGNFMMAFPKVWFYRHEDSQYNYIEISNHRLSDDWKCYAHINTNGQEVDFIYLPLFKGVIKDSKLRSLPGQIPQGNTTATTEANAATALGSRWQIWDHSSVECLNDLLTLMSKSIDSQGRFGQGRSTGYDSADTVTYGKLQSGTLIKKGKFHGYSATTKEVKVFGIEGFWANRWDRLQGMLLVDNVWKIKMTPPYNFTGTDFVTLSNAEVPSGNGYLSKVQTSEYGSIPASIANGSSSKYFKEYFYKAATSTRVALRGGYCHSGGSAGFRSVNVNCAASDSAWSIGASPVYK